MGLRLKSFFPHSPCYPHTIVQPLRGTLTSLQPLEKFQSPQVFQSADLGS